MTTYFDFVLQPGYCGPLNYFFYGDDDLLVFLSETTVSEDGTVTVGETKQVADIGGVHSSLGMYVDLWEFIDGAEAIKNSAGETIATGILNDGEKKTYRLSVYYTERGASGSSCYMRFTVPFEELAIDPITFDQELQVEKIVKSNSEEDKGVYAFELDLENPNGDPMVNQYPYKRYNAKGEEINTSNASIVTGTKFFLRDGEKILISDLPKDTDENVSGYKYTVKELGKVDPDSEGYPDTLNPNTAKVIPLTTTDSTTFMTGTIEGGLGQNLTLGNNFEDEFEKTNYVRFINALEPGMLELEKVLSQDTEPTDKDFTFNIDFKKADGTPLNTFSWLKSNNLDTNWVEQADVELTDGKGQLSFKAGEKVMIYNLPEGATYTITEAKDTYYGVKEINVTGSGEAMTDLESGKVTGTIAVEGNVTDSGQKQPSNSIQYVNAKRGTGGLTVTKEVTGTHGNKEQEFHFTVTLEDKTFSGTYGDMEFTGGVATFTLKHGESATATGLPAGVTYKVTESEADQDGYVTTQKGAEGTIPEGETVTASFTNTKEVTAPEPKPGNLKVSKTVGGNAGDKEKEFHFTVTLGDKTLSGTYGDMEFTGGVATFTLKHGESATATGLPAGITYTVTEDDYSKDGYVITQKGAEGTIPEGETVTASFTNTKEVTAPEPKPGNLKVSKTVGGNAGDKEKEFHFTVMLEDKTLSGTYGDMEFTGGVATFTLKHGESATATGLPAGVTYKVTESEADQDGYVTTQKGAEGTIPEGETVTASFTNTKEVTAPEPKPGNLKVSKTVGGNAGDKEKEFHFTVTLGDKTLSGTYGDMEFTGGVATFTLKHGESATATGLPAGVTYKVTESEADQDGYVTTQKGAEGTIPEDEIVTASFTNTKEVTAPEPKPGNLKVSKTVRRKCG